MQLLKVIAGIFNPILFHPFLCFYYFFSIDVHYLYYDYLMI